MNDQLLIITNNRLCKEKLTNRAKILFDETWNYYQVLMQGYEQINNDYYLLNHPLSGSIKPNQTPYKSLVFSRHSLASEYNYSSVNLLEQALTSYQKFQDMHPTPTWPENVLEDFRLIDLSLIEAIFK